MNVGYVSPTKLTEEEQVFLGELDFDSLFSDFGNILVDVEATAESYNEDSLLDIFASSERYSSAGGGRITFLAFLLVRLTDERMVKRALKELDEFFAVNNIDAEASDWLEAAGVVAEMAYGVKLVFNIIVFLIAIVAVIIIMNTLVISVTERMR